MALKVGKQGGGMANKNWSKVCLRSRQKPRSLLLHEAGRCPSHPSRGLEVNSLKEVNRRPLALGKSGQMQMSRASKTEGFSKHQHTGPLSSFFSWQKLKESSPGTLTSLKNNDPKILIWGIT